ncbi:MAG: hypothetical protein OXN93_07610 [bacterium]|nr:hypothetical protein [bacterium]
MSTVRVTEVENVAVTVTDVLPAPSPMLVGVVLSVIVLDTVSLSLMVMSAESSPSPWSALPPTVIVSASSSTVSSMMVKLYSLDPLVEFAGMVMAVSVGAV